MWLLLVIAIVVVGFLYLREKEQDQKNHPTRNESQDHEWHNYILSFRDAVKTKAEKNLVQALLDRKTADQLYAKQPHETTHSEAGDVPEEPEQYPQSAAAFQPVVSQPAAPRQPIDSTILLLYFGAFLLITSAGLFVALASFSGGVRTAILLATTAIIYGGGYWLLKNQPKLKAAGISFMGTGMVIAPLVGVGFYNLVTEGQYAGAIWLTTSLACAGLYLHALSVIKHQVIGYLLIGCFVSIVESSVLTLSLPTYCYAWAGIMAALALQVMAYIKKSAALQEPARISTEIMVPLSALASLFMLVDFGSIQLSITLLLAALFYGIQTIQSVDEKKTLYATATQTAFWGAVTSAIYAISESWAALSYCLAGIIGVYVLLHIVLRVRYFSEYGVTNTAILVSLGAVVFSAFTPWAFVAVLCAITLLSLVLWLRLNNVYAFVTSGSLLLFIPLMIGQYALSDNLNANEQLLLFIPSTIMLYGATLASRYSSLLKNVAESSAMLYVIASSLLVLCALLGDFTSTAIVSSILFVSYIGLYAATKNRDWWLTACVITALPVIDSLFSFGNEDTRFAVSVLVALAVSIGMSLVSRLAVIRWFVTGYTLLAPIAVGGGGLGFVWNEAGQYALGYLLSMIGLIIGRAIARGRLLVNKNVAISSYEKSASISFVVGYITAAILSVLISLADDRSQLITTLILGFLSVILVAVLKFIESQHRAVIVLPILLQLTLLSALRPDTETLAFALAASSAALAIICYAFTSVVANLPRSLKNDLQVMSVASGYFGIAIALFTFQVHDLLPIAYLAAASLTVYHVWNKSQDAREIGLMAALLGINWQLYLLDITNIHIHTHLIALYIAGFALWRHMQGDKKTARTYTLSLFLIATIPMVLAALGGYDNGIYSYLLIVQQAAFLIIGVMTNMRLLIHASIWVALAAVLYQLRSLGWAFLAIIAVAIIGYAIYRLQKNSTDS